MRGEVYDGRGFRQKLRPAARRRSRTPSTMSPDFDLDLKIGAVVGFNGEALRGVDLKMSRRAGEIRSFGLGAKIGRDATLTGDLRGRSNGRQVVYLESSDAGAFFRFTDIYYAHDRRADVDRHGPAVGGRMRRSRACSASVVLPFMTRRSSSAPSPAAARAGATPTRSIFPACGSNLPACRGASVLRDGVARGPLLGGTIEGLVDYAHDEMHMRGTLVPLYGPNNLLGQIPVVGLFMGGTRRVCSASPTKWSAGRAIRCCASTRSRRWRRDCCARCSNFRPTATAPQPTTLAKLSRQTGLSRTWRLRPSESFITPSGGTGLSAVSSNVHRIRSHR